MKDRKAFNFYRSYYDLVVELPDEQKVKFLMAILNKQFLDIEPEVDGIVGLLYKSQKHSIDKQVDGYKSKMKINTPTQPPTVGPTEGLYLHPTEGPTEGPTEPPYLDPSVQGEEKEKGQVEEQVYVKYRFIEYNKLKGEYQFEHKTKLQKEELTFGELKEYIDEEEQFYKLTNNLNNK
jgi:hypothetical protein